MKTSKKNLPKQGVEKCFHTLIVNHQDVQTSLDNLQLKRVCLECFRNSGYFGNIKELSEGKIQFSQLFYSDPCLIAEAEGCKTEFVCCFTKP